MDDLVIVIFNIIGIKCDTIISLNGQTIPRDLFLDTNKYEEIQEKVGELKKYLSSSSLTALQNTAGLMQKWPILNLTRQLLKTYHYVMVPNRKCDGYDHDGKKKYKRFFFIRFKNNNS
jgi:hypothetical protein